MSNRLALFDCDGTLVDSAGSICAAMDACFAEAGMPAPDTAAVRRIVGLSLTEAMRVLVPHAADAMHLSLSEAYKRAFAAHRMQGLVDEALYDGIAAAMDALEATGWLLGVATGKSDRGLALCLDQHGIRRRFITLQTADRHPSKPHPSMIEQAIAEAGAEPRTTVMIGDTGYDMAMAKAAGVHAIGVAWGYHPEAELRAAGASDVARHPDELVALLEELA